MTSPGRSSGQPPFEDIARQAVAAARGQQPRYVMPPVPLTPEDKAEAAKVAAARAYCTFCGGAHAMPSSAACPRLASFELDGQGKIKGGTFWPGRKWATGRVVFQEDVFEEAEQG